MKTEGEVTDSKCDRKSLLLGVKDYNLYLGFSFLRQGLQAGLELLILVTAPRFRDRKLVLLCLGGVWYFYLGSSHGTQAGLELVTLGISLLSVNGQVPSCPIVILSLKTIS